MPPLFHFAGLTLDTLCPWVRTPVIRAAFVAVLLIPGLVGIIELRPYEYVYYNGLVGGTKGAEGLFAHDYWCTSYRRPWTG